MPTNIFKIILLVFLISGCGKTLRPEDKAKIVEVSVMPAVKIREEPAFLGNKQAIGAAFGIVGALAAHSLAKDERTQIKEYLKQQQIDVGEIARNTFIEHLQQHPFFSNKLKEGALSYFTLEVTAYGLALKPWSVSVYKPLLQINAQLIDASGATIWKQEEYVIQTNDATPAFTYEEYFQAPDNFRNAFGVAAEEIVESLIEELD